MDFVQPVQAVIPGAQGRILGALARTTREVSVRALADIAGVSPAQTSRVLGRLVDIGLVDRRDAPPAALFRLERSHIVGRLVDELATAQETALAETAGHAQELLPAAVTVGVFGSFARAEARADSDLDILLVRPREISEDEDDWGGRVARFTEALHTLTGNRVGLIEVAEDEASVLLSSRRPLWKAIRRDVIVVHGQPIEALVGDARG